MACRESVSTGSQVVTSSHLIKLPTSRILSRVRFQLWQSAEAQQSTLDLTQTRGDFLASPGRDIFAQSQEAQAGLLPTRERLVLWSQLLWSAKLSNIVGG